jgi:hypothetical protein
VKPFLEGLLRTKKKRGCTLMTLDGVEPRRRRRMEA